MLVGVALGWWGCESPTVASGGSGTEAVALTGRVLGSDQRPASGAHLHIRPRYFLSDTAESAMAPEFTADVIADDSGAFRMDSIAIGEYFLEIRDSRSGLLLPLTVTGLATEMELGAAVLKPTGSISGNFLPPQGFPGRIWVQVYGLDRLVQADSTTGSFHLDSLPEGSYTLRALHSASAVNPLEVRGVAARPLFDTNIGGLRLGSFESEDYALWAHSRRIGLNTTASGANLRGLVTDFPLLVRLDTGNFDFSQARGDGRDIRFSDQEGKRLRYQVERWDSAGGRAEVWVRTELIRGNSSDQFLTLHWGNPGAVDWTDGREVFDRDYGYSAVWHLDEERAGIGSAGVYRDAVGLSPGDDYVASADEQGAIGRGTAFNGTDSVKMPVADPSLKPTNRLFASAWFKATVTGSNGGTLLSMGDNYNLRVTADGHGRFSLFDGSTRHVDDFSQSLLDGVWHHLAGVFDGTALILYVDGAEKARLATSAPIQYNKSPHFILGVHGNGKPGFGFIGNMDEAVVCYEPRSADWIKLAFESQRPDANLLQFKP